MRRLATASDNVSRPRRPPPAAQPVMLLGQVHQLEVQGERAQSQVALVRVEAGHRRQQLDVAAQPPVLTATARQLAQLIDHGHGLLALLFSQHLGEQVVEQRQVAGEVGIDTRAEPQGGVLPGHPGKRR